MVVEEREEEREKKRGWAVGWVEDRVVMVGVEDREGKREVFFFFLIFLFIFNYLKDIFFL